MNAVAEAVQGVLRKAYHEPRVPVVNLEKFPKIPTLAQINAIQRGILENSIPGLTPMAEPEAKHYFADGLYGRELFRPKGSLIIGKMHAKRGLYVLAEGELTVWNGAGPQRIKSPCVLVTQRYTKRMSYAHTDATVIVFHATDETDLEKIEAELIIPDVPELEVEALALIELEKPS